MDLNEIVIFAKVVQAQSFTGAGQALGMPKSTVSRKVSELEERLGTLLLQRTTRKLSLTDAGRAYYQYASRIVSDLDEAERAVTTMQSAPRGLLRVTAPLDFGELGPVVGEYLQRFPDVHVELVCTDRLVDMVNEGFDVAVRAGRLLDSSLIARPLAVLRNVLVASPAFLKTHGAPRRPQDLARYPGLVFGAGSDRARWKLVRKDGDETVTVTPRLVANDFDMLLSAAIDGAGVAFLPMSRCAEAVRKKRLQVLLPSWCSTDVPVQAVYPSARLLSPKVKTFVEHLQARFRDLFAVRLSA